ncbi:hypothetical protein ACVWYH_006213 [Bradyrhizobium sp. GM24.11]
MSRCFYRLRMGRSAEALVRGSKRETLQRIRLQFHLMQLGNELMCSGRAFGAAEQPVECGSNDLETDLYALESMANPLYTTTTIPRDHRGLARDLPARGLVKYAAVEFGLSHAAVDHCYDARQAAKRRQDHPFVWSKLPATT